MKYQKYLNARQLTFKQVKALVEAEGLFRADYTALFRETDAAGMVIRDDLVYELPERRILYVYGPADGLRRGQGNIYA